MLKFCALRDCRHCRRSFALFPAWKTVCISATKEITPRDSVGFSICVYFDVVSAIHLFRAGGCLRFRRRRFLNQISWSEHFSPFICWWTFARSFCSGLFHLRQASLFSFKAALGISFDSSWFRRIELVLNFAFSHRRNAHWDRWRNSSFSCFCSQRMRCNCVVNSQSADWILQSLHPFKFTLDVRAAALCLR